MAILDSLLVNLGFVVETKELSKFQRSVGGARKDLLEFGAAALAVGVTLFETAKRFGDNAEELELAASRAGVTTKAYQELAGAASLAGIKQESFTTGLQQFNFNIGQAAIGMGAGVKAFAFLGLSVRDANGNIKSAAQLLGEVSGKLQGLSEARRISIAQQLGFTSDSVKFLLLGSKRINELRKQVRETGSVLSDEGVRKGAEFAEQLKIISLQVRGVKQGIQEALLPTVQAMVKGFEDWVKANKKVIQSNITTTLKGAGEVLNVFLVALKDTVSFMQFLLAPVGGLVRLFQGFFALFIAKKLFEIGKGFASLIRFARGAAAAVAAFDVAMLPAIAAGVAIGAVLAALGVIIQDVRRFMRGQSSEVGELAKKSLAFKIVLEGVIFTFKVLGKIIGLVWDALKGMFKLITFNPLSSLLKEARKLGNSKFVQSVESRFSSIGAPVAGVAGSNRTTNNNAKTTVNATINVTDSPNSQRTAKTITDHFNNMARQAQRNLQSPVVG